MSIIYNNSVIKGYDNTISTLEKSRKKLDEIRSDVSLCNDLPSEEKKKIARDFSVFREEIKNFARDLKCNVDDWDL